MMDSQAKQSWFFGILIVIGVFLIVIVVLANITVVPYTVYKNPEYPIQIKYPSYWKVIENPVKGAIVAFVAPVQNKLDSFQENLNISYQDLSAKPMPLSQFSSLAMKQLTGTLGDSVEVLEASPTRLAGRQAYRFIYAGKADKFPNPIQYYHVWVLDGTNAYIITFAGHKSEFKVYQLKLRDMLGSFKIL